MTSPFASEERMLTGPDDYIGQVSRRGLTESPQFLPNVEGPPWPDYRGRVFVPGERWGAQVPQLQRQMPILPPSAEARPFAPFAPEQIPDGVHRDIATPNAEPIIRQGRVTVSAGTTQTIVSVVLRERLAAIEAIIQRVGWGIVTPVIGGADVEDLTFSLVINGQTTELVQTWSGAMIGTYLYEVFYRIPSEVEVALQVTSGAAFPANNRVKAVLIGQAINTPRPGEITTGALRR